MQNMTQETADKMNRSLQAMRAEQSRLVDEVCNDAYNLFSGILKTVYKRRWPFT